MAKQVQSVPGIVRVPLKNVELAVKLSDAERAQRAATAAELLDKAEEVEDQLRSHSKTVRGELTAMRTDARHAIKAHLAGQEVRLVDCERVYDIGTNATWLDHNGNFYDHRTMTAEEIHNARQPGFFDKDEGLKRSAESAMKRAKKVAAVPPPEDDAGEDPDPDADLADVIQEERQPRRRKDHTA